MTELEKFLDLYINEDLIRIIISGPRQKEGPSKIQIRPLLLKGQVMYQVTRLSLIHILSFQIPKHARFPVSPQKPGILFFYLL